jgi:aminoglycoside phosphotransferase (APT) family kinase protein
MTWGALVPFRRARPRLRRVGEALVAGRHMSAPGLPAAVLHGDLHSGNVVVERGGGVAFVDWSRARIGSPLEDVAGWLQSLAFWEPEVRRTHDTLLRRYLEARGLGPPGTDLRDAYWLAAARNGFTGALRYHVTVMEDRSAGARAREDSARALRDWFRLIRRADLGLARLSDKGAPRRP